MLQATLTSLQIFGHRTFNAMTQSSLVTACLGIRGSCEWCLVNLTSTSAIGISTGLHLTRDPYERDSQQSGSELNTSCPIRR